MYFMKKIVILVYTTLLFFCYNCPAQQVVLSKGKLIGHLQDPRLKEVSGIAVSKIRPGICYVHNDSGDSSRFFAITRTGELKAVYNLVGEEKKRIKVADCEDIAVGPGPVKGRSYVYLADIGDNLGIRNDIRIYRFAENELPAKGTANVTGKQTTLNYPDGARDAETLLIDPVNKYLFIISKREDSVAVYGCSLQEMEADRVELRFYAKLFFPGRRKEKQVIAGDISADGRKVVIKSSSQVYYWKRNKGETIDQCLQRKPVELPYRQEGQQEAISFDAGGKGCFIVAEGVSSPIYYLPVGLE